MLEIFRARGIIVDPATATRISDCRDDARLKSWLARAVQIDRAEQLFDLIALVRSD